MSAAHDRKLRQAAAALAAGDLGNVLSNQRHRCTGNATAHFAGTLGKRTWLVYLADRAPFYYWAHGGSYRCLWYPSVEIVTAPHLTDWASLIEHARERLSRELAPVGSGHDGSAPAAGGR